LKFSLQCWFMIWNVDKCQFWNHAYIYHYNLQITNSLYNRKLTPLISQWILHVQSVCSSTKSCLVYKLWHVFLFYLNFLLAPLFLTAFCLRHSSISSLYPHYPLIYPSPFVV
jgi:hypothetical protein